MVWWKQNWKYKQSSNCKELALARVVVYQISTVFSAGILSSQMSVNQNCEKSSNGSKS